MNMNLVVFGGRLTRDPQIKYLPNNTAVCEFGVVSNQRIGGKDGAESREIATFVDCVAWGKTGEIISQHFQKGKEILITGALKFDSWDDKNGGGKRSKLSINVERFQFVGGRESGSDGGSGQRQAAPQSPAQPQEQGIADEDIPF